MNLGHKQLLDLIKTWMVCGVVYGLTSTGYIVLVKEPGAVSYASHIVE